MADSTSRTYNSWSICTDEQRWDDSKNYFIQIDFPPEDFIYSPGRSSLAMFEGHGSSYPVIQWVRGMVDEITFRSLIWHHSFSSFLSSDLSISMENVSSEQFDPASNDYPTRLHNLNHEYMKKLVDKIVGLTKQDPDLGRPPICMFVWSIWRVRCLVEQISNIQAVNIDERGVPLGYRFSVTLKRYEKYATDDSYSGSLYNNGQTGFTKFVSFKDGDTYELVADREYGDPMLGVALRRLHSDAPFPVVGDVCQVPAESWTRKVRTAIRTTESPILKSSEDQTAILSSRFNNRLRGSRIVLK